MWQSWTRPERGRHGALLALAAALVYGGLAMAWVLTHPGHCLLGEDAALWTLSADALWVDGLRFTLDHQRQPGFVVLVALAGRLVHDPVLAGAVAGALSYGLTAGALVAGGLRLSGRLGGLAALGIAGVAPDLVARGVFSNADLLATAAFLLAGLQLHHTLERPSHGRALATGAVIGVAMLVRPSALLLLPGAVLLLWRTPVLALLVPVGFAGVAGPWLVYEALNAHGPLSLAATDSMGGSDHSSKRFQDIALSEGFSMASGTPPTGLRWVAINVQRISWNFARQVALWPLLALTLWRARGSGRAWFALAMGVWLASIALWQPRHLLPFIALAAVGATAGLPRLTGPWRLVALVLPLGQLAWGTVTAWGVWSAQPGQRCTPAELDAGRFVRAEGLAHTPGHVMLGPYEGFQVQAGFEERLEPRARALWTPAADLRLQPGVEYLYALVQPGDPGWGRVLPDDVELIWQSPEGRLLRRRVPR